MTENRQSEKSDNLAKPQKLPSPTYWPIISAVGITFFFWGFVTSPIISGVGIFIFALALSGWIGILRDEYKQESEAKKSKETYES